MSQSGEFHENSVKSVSQPCEGLNRNRAASARTARPIQSFRDGEAIITQVPKVLLRSIRRPGRRITGAALRTRRETLGRVERCALEDPG